MIGQRFAHYEILEKIGAGGMGEVYRARDSRLDRDVAIKILPELFAGDSDRLARFEREAKLLASLNHANIASIHGLEEAHSTRFLVLELVQGEDLSERIARGPIPLNEAMAIALQIAEALEDAHANGVIHRDLKPANVKITPEGKVKVLDFGLAKALDPESDSSADALSQSPTIMSDATQQGVILGTAAYMSPEQARGKLADHRTDIWAFGCVVYEMLTAHPCYKGETITDILTGILHREPDLDQLPAVRPGIRRVIERCLRKDLRHRLQHIGDARIEIDDALAGGGETTDKPVVASSRSRWAGWAIAVVAGIVIGAAAMNLFRPSSAPMPSSPDVRFTVTPPSGTKVLLNPTLSPNARWLSYFTNDGVLIHDLERDESRALPSLKEAREFVFFSPNSDWIAFNAGGKLKKVRITGGVPVDLIDIGAHPGATWGSRNTIVYPPTWTSPLFEIPDDGGEPRQVTTLDTEGGETGHWSPRFLPDGRHVLFTIFTTRGSLKHSQMSLLDLDTGKRVSLGVGAYPVYLKTGHIVYHRSGLYEMAPFDVAKKEFTGPPQIVMENVPYVSPSGNRTRFFSISNDGVLAYIAVDDDRGASPRSFYRLERNGTAERLPLPPDVYSSFEMSPDGRRLAVQAYDSGEWDLWVHDLGRGTGRRITRESNNLNPAWHPDNRHIAFTTTRLGTFDAFLLDVDSNDPPTPLFTAEQDAWPHSWTPDGALIAGLSPPAQGDNIMLVENGTASELIASAAGEAVARVSPDGRWIAYQSDRSGRNEIYVRPFGRDGRASQVSTSGGEYPLWSNTANELFFYEGPTAGEIMAVSYSVQGDRFVSSRSVPYLRYDTSAAADGARRVAATEVYDQVEVTPDGRLIVTLYDSTPTLHIHVALDGFGELERQAATER